MICCFLLLSFACVFVRCVVINTHDLPLLLDVLDNLGCGPATACDSILKNWQPSTDCSSATYSPRDITCDANGFVTFINMRGGYRLPGSLAPSIGQLSKLTGLWIGNHNVKGTIPQQLALLTALTRLDLQDTYVGGSLLNIVPSTVTSCVFSQTCITDCNSKCTCTPRGDCPVTTNPPVVTTTPTTTTTTIPTTTTPTTTTPTTTTPTTTTTTTTTTTATTTIKPTTTATTTTTTSNTKQTTTTTTVARTTTRATTVATTTTKPVVVTAAPPGNPTTIKVATPSVTATPPLVTAATTINSPSSSPAISASPTSSLATAATTISADSSSKTAADLTTTLDMMITNVNNTDAIDSSSSSSSFTAIDVRSGNNIPWGWIAITAGICCGLILIVAAVVLFMRHRRRRLRRHDDRRSEPRSSPAGSVAAGSSTNGTTYELNDVPPSFVDPNYARINVIAPPSSNYEAATTPLGGGNYARGFPTQHDDIAPAVVYDKAMVQPQPIIYGGMPQRPAQAGGGGVTNMSHFSIQSSKD